MQHTPSCTAPLGVPKVAKSFFVPLIASRQVGFDLWFPLFPTATPKLLKIKPVIIAHLIKQIIHLGHLDIRDEFTSYNVYIMLVLRRKFDEFLLTGHVSYHSILINFWQNFRSGLKFETKFIVCSRCAMFLCRIYIQIK